MAMLNRLGQTETLVYRPDGGDGIEIQATVDRGVPVATMNARTLETQITVLNDASAGIAATTLNVGSDEIDLAERVGGTAASRGVQKLVSQDDDFLTLVVR